MKIDQAILKVIQSLKKNRTFDSHTVIEELFKNHSDELYNFIAKYGKGANRTLVVHGNIGKRIAQLEKGKLIKRLTPKAQSHNIHHNISANTSWKKL